MNAHVANLPDEAIHSLSAATTTGIYYGYAQVRNGTQEVGEETTDPLCEEDTKVYPMAMSLGWNPVYKNEKLSAVSQPINTPNVRAET